MPFADVVGRWGQRRLASLLARSVVRDALPPSLIFSGPAGGGMRDMAIAVRDKVSALKKEGKSREEIVAAKPTADYDAKWGRFVVDGDFFTRLVCKGVG